MINKSIEQMEARNGLILGNLVQVSIPGSQLDKLVGTVADFSTSLAVRVSVLFPDATGFLEFSPKELRKI